MTIESSRTERLLRRYHALQPEKVSPKIFKQAADELAELRRQLTHARRARDAAERHAGHLAEQVEESDAIAYKLWLLCREAGARMGRFGRFTGKISALRRRVLARGNTSQESSTA